MDTLEELLMSWKVGVLFERFQEFGVNIDCLECIDGSALKTIFPEKQYFGPVKRFEVCHLQWLKTLSPQSTTSQLKPTTESNSQNLNEDKSAQSDSMNHEKSFNLNDFLEHDETAGALKKRYEKFKNFTHDERLLLVRTISDYLIRIKYNMNIKKFEDISYQIAIVFVHEEKEIYYNKLKGKNSGLLWDGYYNRLKAYKKKKKRLDSSLSPERDVDNATNNMNDETKKAMEWMSNNNPIDEEDDDAEACLAENWRYCFQYRNKTIESHKGNVEEILNAWPVLKNSYGFSCIEDDFKKMYGSDRSCFEKFWNAFVKSNINILAKLIADPTIRNKLLKSEGAKSFDIEFASALLHLMEPTSIILPDNKRFKPSLLSAKIRLFQLIDAKSQIKSNWDTTAADRRRKKLDAFPIIYGVGENTDSIETFTLQYNEVSYDFETFIEALDATFKFYLFFKVPIPPDHKRFWILINGLSYKIETKSLETTASILSVIKSFKCA